MEREPENDGVLRVWLLHRLYDLEYEKSILEMLQFYEQNLLVNKFSIDEYLRCALPMNKAEYALDYDRPARQAQQLFGYGSATVLVLVDQMLVDRRIIKEGWSAVSSGPLDRAIAGRTPVELNVADVLSDIEKSYGWDYPLNC